MNKTFGIFSSSTNPQQFGLTVTGLITGASVFIIWIAQTYFHITLTSDVVSNGAEQLGTIAAALITLVGLGRKFVIWVQQIYTTSQTQ